MFSVHCRHSRPTLEHFTAQRNACNWRRNNAMPLRSAQDIREQSRSMYISSKSRSDAPSKRCQILKSTEDATKEIADGASILIGGFGLCGLPENLLRALAKQGQKNLTIVSNDCSIENYGIGWLVRNNQIKRMVASFIGENREAERKFLNGSLEVELVPQGTLAEKIRCGGAGIPAFYTPAGFGTIIQQGKSPVKFTTDEKHQCEQYSEARECRSFPRFHAETNYMLEMAVRTDFALIKAWKADKLGNLVFHKVDRNFNTAMARAAAVTIVEAEEIVEAGAIDPSHVHSPCIYTHRLIKGEKYEKPFQLKTVQKQTSSTSAAASSGSSDDSATVAPAGKLPYFVDAASKSSSEKEKKVKILRRIAQELTDGMFVNLGFGIPLGLVNYLPPGLHVTIQSENGVLGVGPFPAEGQEDADMINAGKQTVTAQAGASFFAIEDAFGMIRGGHLDVVIHGALQVSQFGDIANWMIPGKKVNGMGSAMDTASCPHTRIIVAMLHTDKHGELKIRKECQLPISAARCVDRIITEKAVFDVDAEHGLTLREIAPESSLEDITKNTGCEFKVAKDVKPMKL